MPDTGPLGETRFDASVRAIVAASFVKSPFGGCVEPVFIAATHLLLDLTSQTHNKCEPTTSWDTIRSML